MRDPDYIPVAYLYPPKPPFRWKRIHTAFVIATVINLIVLTLLGWYAGGFAEETIYEVNVMDVMKTDGQLKNEPPPKRLTLDPAKASRFPGRPGGAPAPGNKPENTTAKAPPKLKIDAPMVTPDNAPPDPNAGMVSNAPPPPDASDNGNPEGAAGGTGNDEGPGGTGAGGTGTGTGDGNGDGNGGGLATLVNRVTCQGCHIVQESAQKVRPEGLEHWYANMRWKSGGTAHPLTLGVTLNDQGYVKDCRVVLGSGRSDVDDSAIQLIKQSKWRPATNADGRTMEYYVEMFFEVYF